MNCSFIYSTLFVFAIFFNTCFLFAWTPEFPGETTPTRLEIEIGSSANITCRMNLDMFDGEDSSSLYFIEDDTKNRVPQSEIAIVNASTVDFMLRNATEQNRSYTCMSRGKGIAITHVAVGTPPLEVKRFKCRAYDFKFMICNFTIPPNKIHTLYNLTYTVASPQYIYKCDIERYGEYALCKMSKDNGQYMQHWEFYDFTLIGYNVLGMKKQHFWINHYESVIPPQPVLKLLKVRNDSAHFWWRMSTHSYKLDRLHYDLRLHAEKFGWINFKDFNVHNKPKNKTGYFLDLHNLPYAFYNYTISFRLRVKSAQQDEDLWSEVYHYNFTTSSCLPDAPPTTDVGSFDLIDATEPRVRLYWVQRPFYRENGPNFSYVIKQVRRDGFAVNMLPLQIDRTSAVFHWDRNHHYEFVIKSRNNVGESVESSQIVVPAVGAKRISDYSPDWIRNIYHEPNRTYTLSWNPPILQSELVDYTVFWCFSKLATTNECNDTIQFKHLSKDITSYTTESQKQDQTLTLAVSANYKNFTTGMHWTMCAADISSTLTKMEPQIKQVTSREIDVQWNLEYVCTSLLEGYNITYCAVEDIESEKCLEASAKTETIEKNAKNYVIHNLHPYTAYKIEIYMFSKLKIGKTSDAQIIQTKEAASTPPRNLRFSNITSDSVLLYWLPPIECNGIIRSYTVIENNEHHKIICNKHAHDNPCGNSNSAEITYKLELLSSYTNYTVYVLAHTVEASLPSNEISFTTLVGIPSSPQHLKTIENNLTILQWTQPNLTSDRVDFYEVSIERWYKGDKKEERIYGVIKSTSCSINLPTCLDKNQKHVIRVTAVTAASLANEVDLQLLNKSREDESTRPDSKYFTEDKQLKCFNSELTEEMQLSQWRTYHDSDKFVFYRSHGENGITYGCAPPREDYFILIYIIAVGFGILVGAVFAKYSYNKFQKMRDIHSILPGGLAADDFVNGHSNERDDEFYMRSSKESTHNEQRRLIKIDSGYLGDGGSGGDISAIGVSTPPISMGHSSGYDGSSEDRLGDYCNAENFSTTKFPERNYNHVTETPPPAYTIMEVHKPFVTENVQYNGGYVPPSRLVETSAKPYTTMTQTALPFIPSENCYVKPNQIFNVPTQQSPLRTSSISTTAYGSAINTSAMPNISSSGYVQRHSFQPPAPAYVSYTTVDALNKHENSSTTALQSPAPPSSGYVTHRDLSTLGQHRFS